MANYNDAVNMLFAEKEKMIILGLTGRTGSGCTTASNILKKKLVDSDFEYVKRECDNPSEEYKFQVIKDYISEGDRWVPFTCIEGSCVILSYIFAEQVDGKDKIKGLYDYLVDLQSAKYINSFKIDNFKLLIEDLKGLEYIFKELQEKPLSKFDSTWENCSDEEIKSYYEIYFNKLPNYKNRIRKILEKYSCYEEKKKKIQDEPPVKYHLYTYLLQKIGNNIRASGKPFLSELCQDKINSFGNKFEQLINLIIKYDKINNNSKTRICIDAIRNVNESNYLKDKFRSYYLISFSVDEATRRKRLGELNINEQISLDNVEYNSKLSNGEFFYHQSISNCFEMADIHLVNENESGKLFFLTWQLFKYITLMIHPGLITSSAIERCMQLAYNVKYNSGCISRQVGAVITGPDYAIKSVGWNEVPQGHLSCGLRDIHSYCKGNMEECYSEFEFTNPMFKQAVEFVGKTINKKELHGRKYPFCFKDIYNGYKDEKNQVHTRALHAEENAFLQISKYGGQGVKGGFLFCTASPCELCSKKAYQLGITNIYYIDPYPGISENHILKFGKSKINPKMNLFYGAIGEAYIRLYKPLLPYKDELEYVSGINCKNESNKSKSSKEKGPGIKDLLYHSIEFSIEFKDRENIESKRIVDIEIMKGSYDKFDRKLTWTGSSYDKSELIENKDNYSLIDSKDKVSPYNYRIILNKEVTVLDRVKYGIKSEVKDEMKLMHPYFAHMVNYPTEKLILKVIIPQKAPLIEKVHYVRYADTNMECEYLDKNNDIKEEVEDGKSIYTLEVENPNLFYTYSIEWEFISISS